MSDPFDGVLVLTLTEVATALKLHHRQGAKRGTPDARLVRELIAAGRLRVVDDEQPPRRWTVSVSEVKRYLGEPGTIRSAQRTIGAA